MIVPGAVTVNLAIELRAWARVERRTGRDVVFASQDRRLRLERPLPLERVPVGAALAVLQRLVAAFEPPTGLALTTRAEAPAGAGLGGSSALGVAVGAALNRHCRGGLGREALLRRVMNLETVELGVPTGQQDYLAALHGGLAAYHHGPDGTVRRGLPIPEELAARLVLAYTGQPRRSGFSNWDMFRRFVEGDKTAARHMRSIASIAREMEGALAAGDLDAAGRLLGDEGRLRYRLAPTVATGALLRADRAARKAGALGVKVCGAGGGGCLVAFTRDGLMASVASAMTAAGALVLPVKIARHGLRFHRTVSGIFTTAFAGAQNPLAETQ